MTDLIDLATLASLGQHFSTQEDVDQLRGALASVQNDLTLIKSFLLQQFGSEFASTLSNDEHCEQEENERLPIKKERPRMVEKVNGQQKGKSIGGGGTSAAKSVLNHGQQQDRPKPPPLQRFTRVNNSASERGNQGSSTVITKTSAGSAVHSKSEKFRNFLSMRSFKSSPTGGGGNNLGRLQNRSASGNGGALKSSSILLNSTNGMSFKVESPHRSVSGGNAGGSSAKRMRTGGIHPSMDEVYNNGEEDEGFNVSEEAGVAVAVENGNFVEVGEEDFGYAAYEDTDYQEDEYDDSMAQMNYQDDDGTVYDNYYPMDGLEITDGNGSVVEMVAPNQNSSLRRRSTATVKKTQQRRLSLPATATSGDMADDANMANNSGGGAGDPNFLKKCKVCHEEVPSYSLFNHVVSAHYNGEVPTCSICKKTFTYKQGLISHMRYHDAEKYDKACSYCGKKFIRRSDVVIHERRLHTGERPFQCPVPDCNQGFVRRYCLLTHVKTNHGEPYMSQIARGELTS